jgi:hypothetical protein
VFISELPTVVDKDHLAFTAPILTPPVKNQALNWARQIQLSRSVLPVRPVTFMVIMTAAGPALAFYRVVIVPIALGSKWIFTGQGALDGDREEQDRDNGGGRSTTRPRKPGMLGSE